MNRTPFHRDAYLSLLRPRPNWYPGVQPLPPQGVIGARELGEDACQGLTSPQAAAQFAALNVYHFWRITKSYWTSDIDTMFPSGIGTYNAFDGAVYETKFTFGTGGCANGNLQAIPTDTTLWISLDVETPYDDAITGQPYSYEDAVAMRDFVYQPLIDATRVLAPNAKISLYNMTRMGPNAPGTYDPDRWLIIKELHESCDGIDPSMWRHEQDIGPPGSPDFIHDVNVTSKRLEHAFLISAEQGDKPIHAWATSTYSGQDIIVPLDEQRVWYDIWSAYDIAGYWIYNGETNLSLPPILAASLAQTPVTLPIEEVPV